MSYEIFHNHVILYIVWKCFEICIRSVLRRISHYIHAFTVCAKGTRSTRITLIGALLAIIIWDKSKPTLLINLTNHSVQLKQCTISTPVRSNSADCFNASQNDVDCRSKKRTLESWSISYREAPITRPQWLCLRRTELTDRNRSKYCAEVSHGGSICWCPNAMYTSKRNKRKFYDHCLKRFLRAGWNKTGLVQSSSRAHHDANKYFYLTCDIIKAMISLI